ncbi:hypothetical protein Lpp126_14955 [Lacticaseibacillus paracasei subsp. paracasei Lpp126]|uniref:Glycosyltransferase 2-like domain-containing protein n=1 Tax=Lacticaseibacillus paracasei subsp. paracasei Lpp126 TaxID=1256206 RepID=S2RJN6_LACPA|nr:hypothetical protein Lpp126_14955 [Lacticaseibacillus paracasei subsp. paracasei Lpp126]
MAKTLTVSIAAYNVEGYLDTALKSIAKAKLRDDVEVLVIDDGATDGTLKIAEKYEKHYPGVFFAVHKANGGYGSTVDWAIQNARGKYIKLLDGDDWFDSEALDSMIVRMKQSTADVFVSNVVEFHEDNGEKIEKYPFLRNVDEGEWMLDSIADKPAVAMWGFAFSTKIAKKTAVQLPKYSLYTDQLFVVHCLREAKSFEAIPVPVYYWRIGREEQSNNIKSISKHADDVINVARNINDYYIANAKTAKSSYFLKRVGAYYSVSIAMLCMIKKSHAMYRTIRVWDKFVKKNQLEVYRESQQSKKCYCLEQRPIKHTGLSETGGYSK